MRIKNLEFKKCTYIGKIPIICDYEIVIWLPNKYYNKQSEYIKEGDYYYKDKATYHHKFHKSVFENPEYCLTLLKFEYNDNCYEINFVEDRPIQYEDKFNLKNLWNLIKYGNNKLNYETN